MKTFDEKAKQLEAPPPPVNCPGDVHTWASDTPKDWETCACGKFYYIAVKNEGVK